MAALWKAQNHYTVQIGYGNLGVAACWQLTVGNAAKCIKETQRQKGKLL